MQVNTEDVAKPRFKFPLTYARLCKARYSNHDVAGKKPKKEKKYERTNKYIKVKATDDASRSAIPVINLDRKHRRELSESRKTTSINLINL